MPIVQVTYKLYSDYTLMRQEERIAAIKNDVVWNLHFNNFTGITLQPMV